MFLEINPIAHITRSDGEVRIQTVSEHCRNTAEYTAESLQKIGLCNSGYLAGLLHDMGKCTEIFKQYIQNAFNGEKVRRGTVNHTFAAVIFLFEHYHTNKNDEYDKITCEILAWVMGSHHGLFDCVSPQHTNGFYHRLKKDKTDIFYEEAQYNFLENCSDLNEIDSLFKISKTEIQNFFDRIYKDLKLNNKYSADVKLRVFTFMQGLAARLILSALIDGDRRDTAEFMQGKKNEFMYADKNFWINTVDRFEKNYKSMILDSAENSQINQARRYISDQSMKFANMPSGIYKMTLPTGAGKTLSALRYSIHHAKKYEKKRIIFVIPLLSILDQNSKVIKEYIGSDIVLEHHSNVLKSNFSDNELDEYELLSESWESPVIITTLVQLLNVLFSGKTNAIRRMNSLTDSVIVIDEVQTIPRKTMYMFNSAINFLADYCKCTVILSSATQPGFDKLEYPVMLSENSNMIRGDKQLFSVFKRTEIIDKTDKYGMSYDELTDFAEEVFEDVQSLLIICNTKRSAKELFERLSMLKSDKAVIFHLSTSMCMKHRQEALSEINNYLNPGSSKKIICVSTQLVEAGVDFSFESCIRVKAGLDNIAQAAGRCNRSGEFNKICNVYIISLKDENLTYLKDIKASQDAYNEFYEVYQNHINQYENDMLSDSSVDLFYDILMKKHISKDLYKYPYENCSLFEMLSVNNTYNRKTDTKEQYFINQAFKSAGEIFEVFDNQTTDVIVPYNDEAKEIIAELCSEKTKFDIGHLKDIIRQAKPYTISLYKYQMKDAYMFISDKDNRFFALQERYYNEETGFDPDNFQCY